MASSRTQAASLTAETRQAQAEAAQLAPYTNFLAVRQQREEAVSELAQSRFDWAHAFHELGRVLPADVSISSLSGTIGSTTPGASPASASAGSGSAVTSATPPGSVPTFTISGCATSQPEVAQALIRLRLMDGVSSVTLQSSTKEGGNSGAGGSGGCPNGDPSFTVQVTYDPLPSVSTSDVSAATPGTSSGAAG
jgi:Tfp pilus assembly protein PilN